MTSLSRIDQYYKIVKLRSWNPRCLELLEVLAENPQAFEDRVKDIEWALAESRQDEPLPDIENRLNDAVSCELYAIAVRSEPIHGLFKTTPSYSDIPCSEFSVLAKLADIEPDRSQVFKTRDFSFMRILWADMQLKNVTVKGLVLEDFTKLAEIWLNNQLVLEEIFKIIRKVPDWNAKMRFFEEQLKSTRENANLDAALFDQEWHGLVQILKALPQTAYAETWAIMVAPPNLSALLYDEISAFKLMLSSHVFQDFLSGLGYETKISDKGHSAALRILETLPSDHGESISRQLELRLELVRHFLELRKFAKLDTLDLQWPELASLLQRERTACIILETQALQPQMSTDDSSVLWSRYRNDEKLLRFFQLRPYLRDIYPDEIMRYKGVNTTSPSADLNFQPAFFDQFSSLTPLSTQLSSDESKIKYQNFYIEFSESPEMSNLRAGLNFRIQLISDGEVLASSNAVVDPEQLTALIENVRKLHFLESEFETPTRQIRGFAKELQAIGTMLYDWFLRKDVRQSILQILATQENARFYISLKSDVLLPVPWETLYVTEWRAHLCLSHKYSVVRFIDKIPKRTGRSMPPPLRLLAVLFAERHDLNIEQEEEILTRSLSDMIARGLVQLTILKNEEATIANLQRTIRLMRPHVFHFVGHSGYDSTEGGYLVLSSPDRASRLLFVRELEILLRDTPLSLAILNGCDTGTVFSGSAVAGVAGGLVSVGITSVIATLAEISDKTGLMFTREFYRAFIDGYPVEAALTEARKAMSIENWNWANYSLFSSTEELDQVRLSHMIRSEPKAF